jgi:predicted Zn-dependent peptidase
VITTLPNGLRVCTRPMSGVQTATISLLADCGSRHEPEAINGIAHLFEHMVFKGAGKRSARQISEAIEDVGGELNACTERDGTSFTASVLSEHVPLAVELLSDLVARPLLQEEDLERERQVVLQELAEAQDTPSDIIFDELWSAAFADQALGRSILGSESSLDRTEAADLHSWREKHYCGNSLILVAAGDVEHEAVVALAEEQLGELAPGSTKAFQTGRFTGGARVGRTPSEQAHLTLAFEGPAVQSDNYLAARLFADIVGGGASSRLFQEVREERGLAYTVSAALQPYRDTGIFYVHAATAQSDGAAATQLIADTIERAATDISERELLRAKNQARAGMLMSLETSWGQASAAARQISIYGRLKSPAEVVAELQEIRLEQVRAAGLAMISGPTARATIGMPAVRAA